MSAGSRELASSAAARPAGRAGALAVVAGCAPPVLIAVNFAVVSVAARDVARDLALGPGAIAWAFSAYNLVLGFLLLACGRVADRYGCRRALLAGLGVFAMGGAAVAAARSGVALVAGRCVQGAGAALMTPAALALLTTATPAGPARRRALRHYGVALSAGYVAGALAGGALTTALGWRVAVACALAPAAVAAVAASGLPAGGRARTQRRNVAATLGVALPVLLTTAGTAAAGAAGALAVGLGAPATVLGLRRLARPPRLRAACAAAFVLTGTSVSATLMLTLELQGPVGLSPLGAGALFACFGLAAWPGARLAARLEAWRAGRATLSAGLGAQGAGILLAGAAAGAASGPLVAVALAVFGTGHVIGNVGAATTASESVAREAQGEAAGVLSTANCLGAALGPALAGRLATTGGGFGAAIAAAGASAVIAAAALAAPSRARSAA